MSATYKLLTRWKSLKGLTNDSQAADALHVKRQTIQNWKEGRNGSAVYIERMARDLGEDPVKTILEAYAEQSQGDAARVLEKLSKRFGAVVLAVGMGTAALPVRASDLDQSGLYIMRSIVWISRP